MSYIEMNGDLIALAKQGEFDVIAHGCNCMCRMGAGIAPQMASAFGCNTYPLEAPHFKGLHNKLGQVEYQSQEYNGRKVYIVNAYTQYSWNAHTKPLDYEALTLCMRKLNGIFKGRHIGLPKIGAGLAGGDWERIKGIIQTELSDCMVTVVNYTK